MVSALDLSVNIGSLALKNPIMPASGTFGYGTEFTDFFDTSILGAVVLKGVSRTPVDGNPCPRIYETPAGMLNAIGLQNIGVEALVRDKMPALQNIGIPVIANIWGRSEDEYVEVAAFLEDSKEISALEMNISCPNVSKGGLEFGSNPQVAAGLTSRVRKVTSKHLWVKLSPSAPSIAELARAVEDAGADAVSLINSIPAMAVDVETRKPQLANVIGGLSGPAIHPIAVRMVYQATKAVKIPVIGVGGIASVADVLEFIIVGAAAVQVGTMSFVNPLIFGELLDGISEYCERNGIERLRDIIGSLDNARD
jgi:dihydroorotate dehydrogenase (NAD+) catalytic subunit